jgi:hypothetical protein
MPIGGVTPINQDFAGPVPLGWTSDAPANKIVGWDPRMTVERVFEIGADISRGRAVPPSKPRPSP